MYNVWVGGSGSFRWYLCLVDVAAADGGGGGGNNENRAGDDVM